ncbi:Calx-beta domain-containing protein [Nocardioides marmorisolisilvae]|uniref:Calx-beta domain-containing protein n=1 Tax=Nocardioides marmorisolisilvae TaxID=1542737 RepID=UPI0016139AA1|nr:Calx-beta domain-containing protein [Nocardioides marmorisolisilvae]
MPSPLGRRFSLLAAGGIILTSFGAITAFAAEPKNTSTIADGSAWYTQAYDNFPTGGYLTPKQADVTGPQRAPFGPGSHQITIGESSAQTELYRTDAYDGVKVADLSRLEYSELARPTTSGDRQPVYLRLSVDNDGDGNTDASLFFYPANNGTPVNNTWQSWDVAGGTIDVDGDNGGTTTLAAYADAHPDATLVNDKYDANHDAGSLALIAGGSLGGDTDPQTNGEYFVDRVIVGVNDKDTLYDLGGGSEVSGGTTDVTVDPAHDGGWKHQAYDNDVYLTSNQTLVDGPGTPPLGGGSLRFSLSSSENADRVELFRTTQYDGTLLRDLRAISYSTYQRGNTGNDTPQQPVYLRFSLDDDDNGTTDDTLFFFPANNGTVQQSAWQTWNAADGVWGVNSDPGPADSISINDYLVAHPDARIVVNGDASAPDQPRGGVAFLVGGGGAGQMNGTYYLDNITLSKSDDATGHTVTGKRFDLEPTEPTLSIGDASVSEGNKGATLTFPVTLSRPFAVDVTAHFATADSSATSPSDFTATSGTVTIPAGSTTANLSVAVKSDRTYERTENLHVFLSDAVGATVADGSAVGSIVNDDTRVDLGLSQSADRRLRVSVASVPSQAGAPVNIYRVTASGYQLLKATHLNSSGRYLALLNHHYNKGEGVTVVAVVDTSGGKYSSERGHLTIK